MIGSGDLMQAMEPHQASCHYRPGLVGGYCIPVDLYYLVKKAKEVGYHPQVILAGRSI
jgi:UDP-N-acetyl-D-mannosaminuronate dehydrogenase